MSNNHRLETVQQQLVERGVLDVKFCFNAGAVSTLPSSQVANDVADFLEAYVAGKFVAVDVQAGSLA